MEQAVLAERWQALSAEVASGMAAWRAAHPRASLREIEAALDELWLGVRARIGEEADRGGRRGVCGGANGRGGAAGAGGAGGPGRAGAAAAERGRGNGAAGGRRVGRGEDAGGGDGRPAHDARGGRRGPHGGLS